MKLAKDDSGERDGWWVCPGMPSERFLDRELHDFIVARERKRAARIARRRTSNQSLYRSIGEGIAREILGRKPK